MSCDFICGIVIGLIAAVLSCGAWMLRGGYGEPPWVIMAGAGCGYFGGVVGAGLLFMVLLAEAFKPR